MTGEVLLNYGEFYTASYVDRYFARAKKKKFLKLPDKMVQGNLTDLQARSIWHCFR